jgi:hypothetical protein
MVFESTKGDGSLVALIDATDTNGNSAVMAIQLSRIENHHEVNSIRSMYGKEDASAINDWIRGTHKGGGGR